MPQQLKSGDDVTSLMNNELASGQDVTHLFNEVSNTESKLINEKKSTNETGIGGAFSTIENNIGEFFNKHPTAKKYLSYLLDTTQDTQKKLDEQGKGGKVIGDEYLEIPYVREAFKEMSSKISPENKEGSALRGFASGALEAIGGLAATGYDPRNVSRFHALEGFGSNKVLIKQAEVVDEVLPLLKREQKLLGTGGPRFIAGEAGIAENRPYTMDIAPVNPSMMGDELTGTILPRELEGLSTISPEMAANSGLTLGRLNPVPPEYSSAMREEYLQSIVGDKPIQVEPPERIATEAELGNKLAPITEEMPEGGPEFQKLEEPDFPQFMRVPGTNPSTGRSNIAVGGADERVLDVLGTALYSRDRPATVAKELIQNSIDELKISGNTGPVRIAFGYDSYHPITENASTSITVQDHGRGMGAEDLYTIFTDVGKTGKGGESTASGGFGFAKAAPLLGGDYVKIESVVLENGEKIKYTFEGNPKELKNQKVGVALKSESTDQQTGFKVEVYFPREKSLYSAGKLVEQTVKNSPGLKGIEVLDDYSAGASKTKDFLSGKPIYSGIKTLSGESIPARVETISTPGAEIDIHYELDNMERNSAEIAILNNGLYALSDNVIYGQHAVPHVPRKIVANVKATVEEGAEGYPFSANRESLSTDVTKSIKNWIEENITNKGEELRVAELQKVFDSLVPKKGNDFVVLDSGKRYNSAELVKFENSETAKDIAYSTNLILNELQSLMGDKALGITDKYGFIITDKDKGGINIPSPKDKGRYAVLINPFSAISMTETPKEAAQRLVHVIIHEYTHNLARSEGAGYTWALSTVYAKYDLEKQLDAKRIILSALTDETGSYAPELQELLSEYTESRGRPETQADTLSRERASEWIRKPTGPERTSGSDKVDGTGVVGKLLTALKRNRSLRLEQDALYSGERSERIKEAAKVKGSGFSQLKGKLNKLAGPLPKVEPEPITLGKDDVKELFKLINGHPNLREFEKIRAGVGLGKVLGEFDGIPQSSELNLLGTVFGKEVADEIIEMHGGFGGPVSGKSVKRILNETANFTKTMQASIDLSAPLRQALPLTIRKEYWPAFNEMFKYAGSEETYQNLMAALETRPLANVGRKAGLKLTDIGDKLEQREEAFMSQIAEKYVPGVRGSERAYTGFLNKLRADVFDNMVMESFDMGHDPLSNPRLMKDIASYVNAASGRSSLGKFEKIALEANYVIFSPRLNTSRLTMLNPLYYAKLHPFVRKQALKSLFAVAGLGALFTGIGVLAGGSTELNPSSSDFGKLRIGNTRIDPFGGFQQYVVAASKLLMNSSKSTVSGKETELGSSFVAPTRLSVLTNFAESKLSPIASFLDTMLKGKDFTGQPANLNKEVISKVAPIMLQDLYMLAKEDPKLLPLALFAGFGMGIQTYENRDEDRLQPISEGSSEKLQEIQP